MDIVYFFFNGTKKIAINTINSITLIHNVSVLKKTILMMAISANNKMINFIIFILRFISPVI